MRAKMQLRIQRPDVPSIWREHAYLKAHRDIIMDAREVGLAHVFEIENRWLVRRRVTFVAHASI